MSGKLPSNYIPAHYNETLNGSNQNFDDSNTGVAKLKNPFLDVDRHISKLANEIH